MSRCLSTGDYKYHEHFCSQCLCGPKVRARRGGWWRCSDKKCVKLPSAPCKKHNTTHNATLKKDQA